MATDKVVDLKVIRTLLVAAALAAVVTPAAAECWPPVLPSASPIAVPAAKCEMPAGARNHKLADFYLYDTKCEHSSLSAKVSTKWSIEFQQLPDEIKAAALEVETKRIESIPPTYDHEVLLSPSGFGGFCRRMNLFPSYFEDLYGREVRQ